MINKKLRDAVDDLGTLKAQISELTKREAHLKKLLIDSGETEIDGEFFRVTVSTFEQDRLDMDAVRAKLSPQFIAAHSTTTTTTRVAVKAQVRDSVAA